MTPKQIQFCEHYIQCWNGTEAALRAGYSQRSARAIASENLTKPDIIEYIKARSEEIALGSNEVLLMLADQARGTMAHFLTVKNGRVVIDLAKAEQRGKLHLIKRLKQTRYPDGTENIDIELYDAQAALGKLANLLGLEKQTVFIQDARTQVVNMIANGEMSYEFLEEEVGGELARALFEQATGYSVDSG